MVDDLHFFRTSSSSSLEMLSVGRGVDGGWEGFIQGGRSKVAALGSYVFLKKLSAVFSSKAGSTCEQLSSLKRVFANRQKFL